MVLGNSRNENLCGLSATSDANLDHMEVDPLDNGFGSNPSCRGCNHLGIYILHPNPLPMGKCSFTELRVNACIAYLWLHVHR